MSATPACKIKLCGLRTEEDIHVAAELGVDAIGLVLTQSPRQVTPLEAETLRALVPASIRVHGVFAGDSPDTIRALHEQGLFDVAQVHGPDLSDPYWDELATVPLIHAFRVKGPETLAELEALRGETILLDAYVPGLTGGTGQTFDWYLARQASEYGTIILAGGLTPENIADAITIAAPAMVDVSGGIEREKGVKDHARMRAFVKAVRGVE